MSKEVSSIRHNSIENNVLCPRCGYDLQGITATYAEVWPLSCVCSECGLDFTWKEYYEELDNPWLFEWHYKSHPFGSYFKTNFMMLRPEQFLQGIKLTDHENIRSVILLSILNILVFFLTKTLVIVSSDVVTAYRWNQNYSFRLYVNLPYYIQKYAGITVCIISLGCLIPITIICLHSTLSHARILNRHFIRLTAYSLVFLTLPLLVAATWGLLNLIWTDWDHTINWIPWFLDCPYEGDYGYLSLNVVLLIIWWGFADSRYLKIKHPWYVSITMVTLSGLLLLTIMTFLAEYRIIDAF